MWRSIRLLHLRRLGRAPLRSVLAVLAIGAGVSMAVAIVVDQLSLSASVRAFTRATAGPAPLRVVGSVTRGGLDASVADTVAGVPGVELAVPVIQTVALTEDGAGAETLVLGLGVDCVVAAVVFGELPCPPVGNGAPVVAPALARRLGSGAVLRTDLRRVPLDAAPTAAALDAVNDGRVVVWPLAVAQAEFARADAVDAVHVVPAPGQDLLTLRARLQEALGDHVRVVGADEPPGNLETGPTTPLLAVVSLFALGIGAQLVYNTVALSLEERRRDLAVTTALGGSRSLVTAGVLVEATALGTVGGLLGVAGGVVLARPLVANLSELTERFAGVHLQVHVSPAVVAIGVALGVGVSGLAAWLPTRRAVRRDLVGELSGSDRAEQSRPAPSARRAGLLVLLGLAGIGLTRIGAEGGAVEPWQPPVALLGLSLATAALFRAVGRLTPLAVDALRRLPMARRGPVAVALTGLARDPGRTAAMATSVGAAVALACVLGSLLATISAGSADFTERAAQGRVWVSTLPSNNAGAIDSKVSPTVLRRLHRLPGVAGVDGQAYLQLLGGQRGESGVTGVEGAVTEFRRFRGSAPGREVLARGEVMIGPALARREGVDPGGTITVPGRDGLVELRVGGIWEDPNNLGTGITMPLARLEAIWGRQPDFELYVRPVTGTSPEVLADRINAAGLDPDLRALAPRALADDIAEEVETFISPFWALQRGMLLVAFVASVSTLLLLGLQRRREHGLLLAVGLSPGGLGRLTLVEAGVVGVLGSVLGAAGSVGMVVALLAVAPILTGLTGPFRLDLMTPLVAGSLATVVVLAGAALPAWRTSRLEAVAALRHT